MAVLSLPSSSIGGSLRSHEFTRDQEAVLDFIDKLQYARLGNVNLPQIAVVGGQSAGKSSVLQALTGLRFPHGADVCTKFPIEIRLRRSAEERLSVHIIPQEGRHSADLDAFKDFAGIVDQSTSFDTLMKHAIDLIAPGQFATGDVFVIEKTGPEMPLLTLVDLPGLVLVDNNQQSEEDIAAINAITDRYMMNPRTIILAVVGGNIDYVQATVLKKAREFDPKGKRTIGILTKPDMIKSIGLEEKFISLVTNHDKLNAFDLGWYVILNPGPGESWTPKDRKDAEEEFFSRNLWNELPLTMCGVSGLGKKLSILLQQHIGRYIPALQTEIQQALFMCEAELESLGSGKDTVEELRDELTMYYWDSHKLVGPGVKGTYENTPTRPFFSAVISGPDIPPQNIRARVVEENFRFSERLRTYGQKVHFVDDAHSPPPGTKRSGKMTKEEYVKKMVNPLLRINKGMELPDDHNRRLVYKLFQDQSENWLQLAREHKIRLGVICNEFLGEIINRVWPPRMQGPLRNHILEAKMKEMLDKAHNEVDALYRDLQLEVPHYNPEYLARLGAWRMAPRDTAYSESEEFLEKMIIYYDLSSKVFIHNIVTQVVERHLLEGLLNLFNPVEIQRTRNEIIEAIAADSPETRQRRISLKADKRAIEEALAKCVTLAMRKELSTYDEDASTDSDSNSDNDSPDTAPIKRRGSSRRQTTVQTAVSKDESQNAQRHKLRKKPVLGGLSSSNPSSNGTASPSTSNRSSAGVNTPVTEDTSNIGDALPRRSERRNDQHPHSAPPPTRAAPPPPPPAERVSYETGQPVPSLPSRPSTSHTIPHPQPYQPAAPSTPTHHRYTDSTPLPNQPSPQQYIPTSSGWEQSEPQWNAYDQARRQSHLPSNKSMRNLFSSKH